MRLSRRRSEYCLSRVSEGQVGQLRPALLRIAECLWLYWEAGGGVRVSEMACQSSSHPTNWLVIVESAECVCPVEVLQYISSLETMETPANHKHPRLSSHKIFPLENHAHININSGIVESSAHYTLGSGHAMICSMSITASR